MSKVNCKLTIQRLHEVLDYNKETGVFIWKHRDTHKDKIGKIASIKKPNGYLAICIDGRYYYAHRLAWMYVYGEFPNVIDHIDAKKENNCIKNLRSVTQKINVQNVVKIRKHNSLGVLGVHKRGNRYRASLNVDKKRINLGTFNSKELAHQAYLEAKRKFHIGCTI